MRVAPWESGKMAAALQAATTSGRPVLLRTDEAAGHLVGTGSAGQVERLLADIYGFLMTQAGMPAFGGRSR
jgi:prolyl oligopeptidase